MFKGRKILILLIVFLPVFTFSLISCKSEKTIKVAAIVPTGYTGDSMRNAINLAKEEINSSGGLMGQKISIVWVTEGDANKLKNDLTQAIEREDAKFIVGGYSSSKVSIAMQVMKEKKVLWLGTGGAHPSIVQRVKDDPGMKYYFRVGTLDSGYQGKSIGEFAINVLKPKGLIKAAFIRVNHPYSLEIIKPARETMRNAGFDIVIEDEAVKFNATDFSAFLDKCSAKGVQVIVCSFLMGETTNFIKQVAAKGLNKKISIVGAMAMVLKDEFPKDAGGAEAAAFVTSLSPQSGPVDMTGDGEAVKFANKYKKKYGMSAYWISYIAYDALRVLKAVVKKTGSMKAEDIIKTMEGDFVFKGVIRYKWKKDNHDLYFGEHDGKLYADFPWFQFYPDGNRYCVYPEKWKQKEFLKAGEQAK